MTVRGRAMADCPPGAMLAVGCDEASLRTLLAESGQKLELAAHNAPESCVVAGAEDAVEAFRTWLGEDVPTKRLRTSHAFHSALVEPALAPLSAALAGITLRRPVLPFAANTTGELVPAGTRITADRFVAQARGTVRFAEAMETLARRFPGAVAVEIGPGRVLSALAVAAGLTPVALSPARTARPGEEVLTALGTLWAKGLPLAPTALSGPGRRVHLPGYAFAGPRWMAPEARPREAVLLGAAGRTPGAAEGPDTATAHGQLGAVRVEEAAAEEDPATVLAGLWAELLGHTGLTADADFFDLGGDSLATTHLARRIKLRLGVSVSLRDLLIGRTLGRQTEIVLGLLDRSVVHH